MTEGGLASVACLEHEPNECAALPVWEGLCRVISEYPESIALQDIPDMQREKSAEKHST